MVSGQGAKVSTGTLLHFEKFPSTFVTPRNVDVWLPEGYSTGHRYAVIYMQDGQMLFDSMANWNHQEWQVDETLGRLMAEKKIRDCIVVGIWNVPPERHSDYFPQKALAYLPDTSGRELMTLLSNRPRGDLYVGFIVAELKPYIDANFSTYHDAGNTFIAGSSMGALMALYALCEYPDVFGGAACLSTHWTGVYHADNNPVPAAILEYLKKSLPDPATHKIYFDHGTATLDAMYAPFQEQVDEVMKARGYTSRNFETRVFDGADHSERAWAKRFSIPAIFLLGTP
jgi:enterochelin esterase-like enzyme